MKANCSHSILVVEDDHDILEVILELLKIEGYQTDYASNGKEALKKIETMKSPCLVLLDMMMPIMGGREFLDIMLTRADVVPIPVVIVSAIANKENSKGSVGYLKKPVAIEALLAIVDKYCTVNLTQHEQQF